MSEAEARPPRGAAATPPAAAPGGGGLPAILCTVTAAGAAVIAVLAQGSSDALLLTLLASLAILGVFFLLGTAAGHIRLSERVTDGELAAAMADELETAVLVTARDGTLVYANAAVARVLGRTTTGAASAIEAVLGGSPAAAEALYRLQRAAEAGQVRREEITAAAGEPGGSVPRCLSIEVRPYAVAGGERELGRLALWQIRDTSCERAREAEALTELHRILDGYDDMPVGLAVGRSDGTLQHVNATFARALGLAPHAGAQRALKLADVLPADAAQLLAEHARARPGERAQLDLDLKREDGRALPARIVWSGAAATDTGTGALLLAALPREPERALEQAGEAEVRFSRFFESAPFGIATVGADGRITTANAAFARMILDGSSGLGEHASAVLCRAADANVRAAVEAGLAAALAGHASAAPIEITVGGAAGDSRTYVRRLYISPLVATHARDAAILYVVDATEQKALEEKYAQSQKMEAVGKLAGGIAHDFNNVLTAILGFSDLLLQTHRPGDPAHRDIMNIKNSANRAAGLVGQLLGFSRRQTQQNETLDLGETISSLAPMLGTSVGDTVKIKFEPSRDLWLVKADRSQITNVILNLAVNARDAMPGGGTLSIHARNVSERESQRLGEAGLPLGEYVAIEVADTGCGMTAEVMARMFEPFYTTKGVGKGTGLGLASVYGIVKQSGGFILAESEPGKGTTFRIYLPRVELDAREEPALAPKERKKARPAADLTGTGRVLLVEDEDVVRNFAVRALRGRGYEVLEASTGAEALEVLESEGGRIDIVVSDVVMPEMDGPTLLKELRRLKPDLKIIFVSGYPNEAFQASIDENEQFAFLPKPFSLPQLAAKVKEELRR